MPKGRVAVLEEVPEVYKPVVDKLTKALKEAAENLGREEARFLVDTYYQIQEHRIAMSAQSRTLAKNEEPNVLLAWLGEQNETLESRIKLALDLYTDRFVVGRWCKAIVGIGPVITAGLISQIDPAKYNYIGSVLRFGGFDPTLEWNKGEKRPWNADLKVLFYKIGESFVKVQNRDNDYYGKVFRKWRDEYESRNKRGKLKHLAEAKLKKYKIGKDTEAYKAYVQGKLPPAHLHAMARRKAVALFLGHFCQVQWEDWHKRPFPRPWVFCFAADGASAPHSEESFVLPPNYTPLERGNLDQYINQQHEVKKRQKPKD